MGDLGFIFASAVLTVTSALLFALRFIRWKTILRFHWLADGLAHVVLFGVFYGTLGGAMTAAVACLFFSLLLNMGRKLSDGWSRLTRRPLNAAAAPGR
jgi:hypothetical protein